MAHAALARTLDLPAEPRSASEARRFIRSIVSEAGHPEWQDDAELAVSELVTNAVLHAHSAIELVVTTEDGWLRVEVRDRNPCLPAPRNYDAQATTGRGMGLVAAVTTSHGVESHGEAGKAVWFTLGTGAAQAAQAEPAVGASTPEGQVRLLGLPPTLWLAARQHHDALLRELALVKADATDELLVLADLARRRISDRLDQVLAEAEQLGLAEDPLPSSHPASLPQVPPAVDLDLDVSHDLVGAFGAMQDALDEAEALARSGRFLARPGLPEVVAVRDWACEQVVAQLAGAPAAPWQGADAESFAGDVDPSAASQHDWDPDVVRSSDKGAVAADDANRIIAVSPSLAARLGWEPDELVGRRVVVLVPARFREAHVAGFTRHLTTGDAKALGVDLQLPVLCRDGSEITCAFMIERVAGTGRRAVYVAWITPPD